MRTFVFKPDTLDLNDIGFLRGFSKQFTDSLVFYITDDKLKRKEKNIIGYCSEETPRHDFEPVKDSEWIHINSVTRKVTVYNAANANKNLSCVSYDLKKFKQCDIVTFKSLRHGEYFDTLVEAIHSHDRVSMNRKYDPSTGCICFWTIMFTTFLLKVFDRIKPLTQYSSTLTHFANSLTTFKWALDEGVTSIKVWNMVVAKMFDLILGFVILNLLFTHQDIILLYANESLEVIIRGLKELLTILMGSPIGLKLNHAFNTTLGVFFFYHISLWRAFVHYIKPMIYSSSHFLLFPASLGLSFQAAILQDLIRFCTIHVFCIYVYAARLYGLQIHALISLWRLFIGRKYNPLRQRVDSHQYSHHQLFIGTLGFTILLFLLPTTLLYYVVFTVFRLCLKWLDVALLYVKIILQYVPVLVALLWYHNSRLLAGEIVLRIKSEGRTAPFTLYATLRKLPFVTSIKVTLPDLCFKFPDIVWSKGVRAVLMGTLL